MKRGLLLLALKAALIPPHWAVTVGARGDFDECTARESHRLKIAFPHHSAGNRLWRSLSFLISWFYLPLFSTQKAQKNA